MLYTNHGHDTVRSAFVKFMNTRCQVALASPFFSYSSLVVDMVRQGCTPRLVVRLSSATKPDALRDVINAKIPVRYFTSSKFHSKLYIFGDEIALAGSANLTEAGMQSNQEICLAVEPEDDRFDDLVQLFQSYWDQAIPLDAPTLQRYSIFMSANRGALESSIDQQILKEFGDVAPEGVQVGLAKKSKEQIFRLSYRKTYQEFWGAFERLEAVYRGFNHRQQPEKIVPLRIEIDMFLSFIRQRHAEGESYRNAPLRSGSELDAFIRKHIEEWFGQRWSYLDNVIPDNYRIIHAVLGSEPAIENAGYNEILDALLVCHSFYEQLRFHKGAIPALRRDFEMDNDLRHVKDFLKYLLFGEADFIDRMGNCIFDSQYALRWFKRSCVQELYGWINNENIPICNGRTVKSLRYLGFNVTIFN